MFHFQFKSYNYCSNAEVLSNELVKSTRGKDEAAIYTLVRPVDDVKQWTCEKRGVCKARIHTIDNLVIKPILIHEIEDGHTHGSRKTTLYQF